MQKSPYPRDHMRSLDYFLVRELEKYPKYELPVIRIKDKLIETCYIVDGDSKTLILQFNSYTLDR